MHAKAFQIGIPDKKKEKKPELEMKIKLLRVLAIHDANDRLLTLSMARL